MKKILVLSVLLASIVAQAAPIMKSGEKIAVYGDTIIYYAHNSGDGFLRKLVSALNKCDVKINIDRDVIKAGRFDKKAIDLLKDIDSMVLSKKPDWVIYNGCYWDLKIKEKEQDFDGYRKTVSDTFAKIKAANVKGIVLPIAMVGDDLESIHNKAVDLYNNILREEAKKAGFLFIDWNAAQKDFARRTSIPMTAWGALQTSAGTLVMADAVMRACGIPEEIVTEMHNKTALYESMNSLEVSFSINEYEKIQKAAKAANMKVGDYLNKICREAADKLQQ